MFRRGICKRQGRPWLVQPPWCTGPAVCVEPLGGAVEAFLGHGQRLNTGGATSVSMAGGNDES